MKQIPLHSRLHKGLFAIVDFSDYEEVSKYRWYPHFHKKANLCYAARVVTNENGKKRYELLHRFLLKPHDSIRLDHKNSNGLDCRRENLRRGTNSSNSCNSKLRYDNKLGVKNITWRSDCKLHYCFQLRKKFYRLTSMQNCYMKLMDYDKDMIVVCIDQSLMITKFFKELEEAKEYAEQVRILMHKEYARAA